MEKVFTSQFTKSVTAMPLGRRPTPRTLVRSIRSIMG